MKIIKLFTVLILLNTILVSDGIPQVYETDSSEVGLKKNIIYGTLGYAGLYAVAGGNYERVISQTNSKFLKYYLARISGGKWVAWGSSGSYGVAGITALTGAKKSHLEMHLGLAAIWEEGSSSMVNPAGAIGYRYQKPGGHFIFRIGAAYPESFYLSFGFCF